MDMQEKRFHEALGAVPPLPDGLYGAVAAGVHRKKIVRSSLLAAAAAVVLTITAFQYLHAPSVAQTTSPDVLDELQYVGEFLNGDNVSDDLAVYVSYDDN